VHTCAPGQRRIPVIGRQTLGSYLFQSTAPCLLQEQAQLVVTAQKRGIYRLERSAHWPIAS
jgi:hypothetical protein